MEGGKSEDGAKPRQSYVRNVAAAQAAARLKADHAAIAMLPVLKALRSNGVVSLNALAHHLNSSGHRGPRGGAWTATAVKRALARAT